MKKIISTILVIILTLLPAQSVCASSRYECDVNATVEGVFYTVTFNYLNAVGDETTINLMCEQGQTIQPPIPLINCADEAYRYTYKGWSPEFEEICTKNVEYTAQYEKDPIEYTVTFLNYDGSILSKEIYHYGDTILLPSEPVRASDAGHTYSFSGWDQAVSPTCKGNAEYTATYTVNGIPEYGVVFKDDKGNVIQKDIYKYGESIIVPEMPGTYSDETYQYYFLGWSPEVNPICEGQAEYTATYTREHIEYTVTFLDYDYEVIELEQYTYGEEIHIPDDPERESTFIKTYSFDGWDEPIVYRCEGTATYVATYASDIRPAPTVTVLSSITVVAAVTTTGFVNLAWTFLLGLLFWKKRARLNGYYSSERTRLINYVERGGKKIKESLISDTESVQDLANRLNSGEIDLGGFFEGKESSLITTVMPYNTTVTFSVQHEALDAPEIHTLSELKDSAIDKMLYDLLSEAPSGTKVIMTFKGSGKKIYSEISFDIS